MTRTCSIVLSSAAFLCTVADAQQNRALDADEVVTLAVTRNRDFLALNDGVRETEALLRQAGLRPFPTIETSASTGRPLGTVGEEEYSAGYFQPIETGGKRQIRTSVARFAVELSRVEMLERRRQLTFEVKSRYAEVVTAQRKLDAVRALIQIDTENYDLTSARVSAGDAAPLEAALFLAEANKTKAQQITYTGRIASALSELRRVSGVAPSAPLEIRSDFGSTQTLPTMEELQRRANDRPDLRALRIAERQTSAESDLARAQGKPDLTVSARYSRRYAQFDNQFGLSPTGSSVPLRDRDDVLTFGLSIPVLTRNRNRGNVEAAEAREAGSRQRREFLEGVIPQEVANVYQRLGNAKQAIQLLSGIIGQQEANLKTIRQAYNLGQFRALDVLNEQRRLVETKLSYIDAQLEEEQARIELERATGAPIR